jgi:hypothetical protein
MIIFRLITTAAILIGYSKNGAKSTSRCCGWWWLVFLLLVGGGLVPGKMYICILY